MSGNMVGSQARHREEGFYLSVSNSAQHDEILMELADCKHNSQRKMTFEVARAAQEHVACYACNVNLLWSLA